MPHANGFEVRRCPAPWWRKAPTAIHGYGSGCGKLHLDQGVRSADADDHPESLFQPRYNKSPVRPDRVASMSRSASSYSRRIQRALGGGGAERGEARGLSAAEFVRFAAVAAVEDGAAHP